MELGLPQTLSRADACAAGSGNHRLSTPVTHLYLVVDHPRPGVNDPLPVSSMDHLRTSPLKGRGDPEIGIASLAEWDTLVAAEHVIRMPQRTRSAQRFRSSADWLPDRTHDDRHARC